MMVDYDYKKDAKVQGALARYALENGLTIPPTLEYYTIIDGVHMLVDGNVVLRMGMHPTANYCIIETEHTDRYLRQSLQVAV